MGKARLVSDSKTSKSRTKPSKTPEGREQQMIALAVDLAEKQLREGTASAQVITHYLKLGTENAKLEREILKQQKELIVAKTDNYLSAKRTEEKYQEAINAMMEYQGRSPADD